MVCGRKGLPCEGSGWWLRGSCERMECPLEGTKMRKEDERGEK